AYYQEARNPSDNETLIEIAEEICLNAAHFRRDLHADATGQSLAQEIHLSRKLQADSFPGLVLKIDDASWPIAIDYLDASPMLESIAMLLENSK
ncbi:MAG: DsbA family protein, partial [Arenicellales bacterium]